MSRNRIKKRTIFSTTSLSLIILFLFQFQSVTAQEPTVIKIPNPKKFKSDFDSFILEKSYLPLETNPDCLMPGHNGGIHFYKDYIIISFGQEGIFIFSDKGNFVRRFNLLGPGPEEYKSMSRISIYNDEIFILDQRGGKILIIDINGTHIRTIQTPMYPYDMIHNKSGKLLLYMDKKPFQNKPTEIIEYDKKSKKFFEYMTAENYSRNGLNFRVFSANYTGSFLARTACDTIYNIDGKSANPAYILDFGKLSLPEEKRNARDMNKMIQVKDPFVCLRFAWKQVGQVISFSYSSEERWDNFVFYDMETNSFHGGKWEYPDLELGRIYSPTGSTDNSFVFLVQALSIIEDAMNNPNNRSQKYRDLAAGLEMDDNPVIVFWKVAE